MTDPRPPLPPFRKPIVVSGDPGKEQLAALLRQTLAAGGLIFAAFGVSHQAAFLSNLAAAAGPIVTAVSGLVGIGAIIWGQLKTRDTAIKAAQMASALPDRIARTR